MRLKDKVAVITGGAQGIGLACAKCFLSQGAKVIISDVNIDQGTQAAKSLGENCQFIACDVGDKAQVDLLIANTVRAFGKLDICIANAGIIHTADFLKITEADFDKVIRVNIKESSLLARQLLVRWLSKGTGE